jgi:predicted Fe-Mo cluster-binding NifX family protein
MKIAVAASGKDLDAPIDPRFGRCAHFVLVDAETMACSAVDNAAAAQGSGAGIAAAQLVANAGADVVIASNLGPNAFQALTAGGIAVYEFAEGTVRQAVEALKAGGLQQMTGANAASHAGMTGAGMGMGLGQTAQQGTQTAALGAQLDELRRQLAALDSK